MSNTKKNNKQNNKKNNNTTKKNRFHKPFGLTEYSLRFKNTEMLPKSDIIYYMINNFNNYAEYSIICEAINTHPLILEDCFNIQPTDFPNNLKKNNININSVKMNPKTSLNKLISYFIYMTESKLFKKPQDEIISSIKFQIGKDVRRGGYSINSKKYTHVTTENAKMNNYQITDLLYQNVIGHLIKIGNKNINIDIVNKISILCSQSAFNAITSLITTKLYEVLHPEVNYQNKVIKSYDIVINKNEISMTLNYTCDLLITRNLNPVEIEYPCGKVECIIYIDFRKNTYELKKMVIDYDIDKCGPAEGEELGPPLGAIPAEDQPASAGLNSKYVKVTAAGLSVAGLTTAGILIAPFILGGKNKIQKIKPKN